MRDAAQFFKVLADEARLKILWLLFNHRELCVCDLMAALGITQSKASRHLSTLRHAGLVRDRRERMWSYYALCPVEDDLARQHLELLRVSLAKRPEATPLLAKLHQWLKHKSGMAVCLEGGACSSISGRPRRARRTHPGRAKQPHLAGGLR